MPLVLSPVNWGREKSREGVVSEKGYLAMNQVLEQGAFFQVMKVCEKSLPPIKCCLIQGAGIWNLTSLRPRQGTVEFAWA